MRLPYLYSYTELGIVMFSEAGPFIGVFPHNHTKADTSSFMLIS